jgi:signal peptidase I
MNGPLNERLLRKEVNVPFDNKFYEDYLKNEAKWIKKAKAYIAEGKTVVYNNGYREELEHYGIIPRPVDKRENYIKRCVGIPGDYLELKNSVLYVNGKPADVAENQLLRYDVPGLSISNLNAFDLELNVNYFPGQLDTYADSASYTMIFANKKQIQKLKRNFPDVDFTLHQKDRYVNDTEKKTGAEILENYYSFPNTASVNNRVSDFKKFWIPKKGVTVKLTAENLPYYRRIITAYEGHTLDVKKDGTIRIDGKSTDSYTFEMNYYWMMGDNRFNSADSRMWGFVPEDHIVGKASMVWMSSGPQGVRWDRLFMGIE